MMALLCPCCKASNEIGPNCRRCKADLGLLFAVEAQRGVWVAEARRCAAEARLDECQAALEQAHQLRAGTDVDQLRAALKVLRRDFVGAWAAYHALVSRQ